MVAVSTATAGAHPHAHFPEAVVCKGSLASGKMFDLCTVESLGKGLEGIVLGIVLLGHLRLPLLLQVALL